ncbi:MAG: DUF790 family protein [bacterium]|nr:DUF790 family protein [bacterium]
MLTKEHAIAEYKNRQILPDRLNQKDHAHYVPYAESMLEVYRRGSGKTRQALHRAVRTVFENEPDCPSRRIDAFCKLLDDVSAYDRDIGGKAANLRKKVFRRAAGFFPLVQTVDRLFENRETDVKAKIAEELKRPWPEIEGNLFADVTEYHRLKEFEGYPGARELLSRYNVAQVQAALYRAVEMTVWCAGDTKTILRYAKLARLMHTIQRTGEGRYRVRFDGPASVLRKTRRYGVAMAKFLPSLLACRDWRMHARIATGRKGYLVSLQLSPEDRLKSHLPAPEEFDSSFEETFAKKWGEEKREGWALERESEILHKGQKVFTPDFVFRHEDGRMVYLEIVGFWTPEYLRAKFQTLEAFREHNILVAIAESVAEKVPQLAADAIRFKSSLSLKDVLQKLA